MKHRLLPLATAGGLLVAMAVGQVAFAQKQGGVLKLYHWDSPASVSIHEEQTYSTVVPMMDVFNNLVMYDQHVPQNNIQSIVPDLASEWSWDEGRTQLTFRVRRGVKWHDGKSFTAKDVKCTWDMLLGKSSEKLRLNPRRAWYRNLDAVTVNGDYEVTFHLKRPQPSFVALLASGYSPVYPCHVPPRDMRTHQSAPARSNSSSSSRTKNCVTRNPDYWRKARPYLDGIEYTIIKDPSTRLLAFIAGKFDMTFPYQVQIPMLKDVKSQAPQAICELAPMSVSRTLILNRDKPPFDNPDVRRALALTLDRKAFIDILTEGQGSIGGAMQPPPEGQWGMPADMLKTLPGYGPDIGRNRQEAREIMSKLGYGPGAPLKIRVSTRNAAGDRDVAVILIDQLKEIHIDGELELIETANWFPKVMRKDYMVGLFSTGSGVDDPDPQFYENYACGSENNITGYCNPEIDKLVDQQSMEVDQEKRKKLVWEIDHQLQEEGARPIIYHLRAATCWQPQVKGLTIMVNSMYNGWRMEDVWLDK